MFLFKTKRLRIEKVQLEDVSFIFDLVNSKGWLKYIGDRNVRTNEDAAQYIQTNMIDNYKKQGFGFFKMVLSETNQAIGICGFAKRDYLEHADIGFGLLPEFEGKGYAYEASISMLNYGEKHWQINPVYAITSLENERSQRLLQKLGLHKKGIISPDGEEKLCLFSTE